MYNEITSFLKAKFKSLSLKDQASITFWTLGALFFSVPLTGAVIAYVYKDRIVNTIKDKKEDLLYWVAVEAVKTKTFGIFNIFKK